MNEYFLEMELRQKRREFLEEAARRRLLRLHNESKSAPAMHQTLSHRLMALVGNQLILWGERLKNRAASPAPMHMTTSCRN